MTARPIVVARMPIHGFLEIRIALTNEGGEHIVELAVGPKSASFARYLVADVRPLALPLNDVPALIAKLEDVMKTSGVEIGPTY